ncbi:MAG TPA: methyltransferase domain-containing protein [Gammaproteobacteria bacterium]|nr:methyltransferase domain-containing protein [Gammaproteobacteria bacterium]
MATVQRHYDSLLSEVYSWMLGGSSAGFERNAAFFERLGIRPQGSGIAVDLGAGSGFQSVPLAQLGFSVVAIDIDEKLLAELRASAASEGIESEKIEIVCDDLSNFTGHVRGPAALAVCMQDTLLHLESKADVSRLFRNLGATLEEGGRFIATFRDLTQELTELERFIPVRSDERKLLTCFLEFELETVKVHDLLYRREGEAWTLRKSYYRKLRLSPDWVSNELAAAGFGAIDSSCDRGFVTIVARA